MQLNNYYQIMKNNFLKGVVLSLILSCSLSQIKETEKEVLH